MATDLPLYRNFRLVLFLFIFVVFLNRYVFGLWLTIARRGKLDETIDGYEPTITVVVPLFNEGKSIYDRKRPLSEKTLRRIFAGLEKFGLNYCRPLP